MKNYYCSSCSKRIELKYKKNHLKSELYLNTQGTVINKYTIINQELCEINDILKNNVIIYLIKGLNFIKSYVNGN